MDGNLTERFENAFDYPAQQRGQRLFEDEAITVLNADRRTIRAKAKGSAAKPYALRLTDTGPTVEARCSCPRAADGHLCKHLLALILELDYGDSDQVLDLREFGGEFAPRARRIKLVDGPSVATDAPPPVSPKRDDPDAAWRRLVRPFVASGANHVDVWSAAAGPSERFRFVIDVAAGAGSGAFHLFVQRRKTTGAAPGPWRPFDIVETGEPPATDTQRWIAELIRCNEEDINPPSPRWQSDGRRGSYEQILFDRLVIASGIAAPVLEQIATAGDLFWTLGTDTGDGESAVQPVRWDGRRGWSMRVDISETVSEATGRPLRTLAGVFHREIDGHSAELPVSRAAAAVPGLAVLVPGGHDAASLSPLHAAEGQRGWLQLLLLNSPLQVPLADWGEFERSLAHLGPIPDGHRPEGYGLTASAVPSPILKMVSPESSGRREDALTLKGHLFFAYGEPDETGRRAEIRSCDPSLVVEADPPLRRDPVAEADAIRRLLALDGVKGPGSRYPFEQQQWDVTIARKHFADVVAALNESGWIVRADGKLQRAGGSLSVAVQPALLGIDWFELDGKASFGEEDLSLPELLAAVLKGKQSVTLGDGSEAILPRHWLDRLAPLAELTDLASPDESDGQRKARFRSSQSLLIDLLLEEQEADDRAEVSRTEAFSTLKRRIWEAGQPKPKGRPPAFRGTLRDYQKQGLGWLWSLRNLGLGGCLADDMGLGKTVQVLAYLDHARRQIAARSSESDHRRLCLAIVPKSLIFNWLDEAARFTPKLRAAAYHGPKRGDTLARLDDLDLLITTYATMRNDIETLRGIPFDTVVLDESQAIKNANSQVSKAVRLLDARHRIAMSGTPVENHLGELWSLFEFLNPGMLGRSTAFQTAIKTPPPDAARPGDDPESDRLRAVRRLGQVIAPMLLRRTKQAVLTELPAKTEQNILVDLAPAERKAYDKLTNHYRAQLDDTIAEKGFENAQMYVLEALLRLRQAACHPGLLDKKKAGKRTGKVDVLLERLEEAIAFGHKALVFSQFVSLLDIVRKQLDKGPEPLRRYEYLDGQTTDRRSPVRRFQSADGPSIFLISLKAGGHGLNLTAADHVFLLDPWWNPAVESQAIDRAYRMGQTRPVVASRLIARDTVEEKIEKLKESKRELAAALVEDGTATPRHLTPDDLKLLLS